MQRRSALKHVALAIGGLASLPAWATNWTPESIGKTAILPLPEEELLGEIVDTFIPQTDTPGAKSLGVHQFALRMIKDCFDQSAQTTLQQGLALTDATAQQAYSKPFASCDAAGRKDVLTRLTNAPDPVGKAFVDMIKGLTIRGYTNSEFYLVNVQKYVMAPGFYHGCVPVQKIAVNGSR